MSDRALPRCDDCGKITVVATLAALHNYGGIWICDGCAAIRDEENDAYEETLGRLGMLGRLRAVASTAIKGR